VNGTIQFLQHILAENKGFAAVVFIAAGSQQKQRIALGAADKLRQKLARHIVVPVRVFQFNTTTGCRMDSATNRLAMAARAFW
jgi:hypothetical protein